MTVETIENCLCFTHGNIKYNVMKCINMCQDISEKCFIDLKDMIQEFVST
jgi:hypothetical protein